MGHKRHLFAAALACAIALAGCAPAGPGSQRVDQTRPVGPKRVTAVVLTEHPSLISKFEKTLPGSEAIEAMVAAGLSIENDRTELVPVLAEVVPSLENGLWKVFPDARMETTWKLRAGTLWHDGTRFTIEDILFSYQLGQDPDLPYFRHPGYRSVESVEAPDPSTITVRWRQPFIEAPTLFNSDLNGTNIWFPLPKHLLEKPYAEDRANFINLSYWSEDFVGTGPYKLRQWVRGSHVVLEANDRYALGRPKIDEIEVRFMPDETTAAARILAGGADLTLGRGLNIEDAVDVARRWPDGKMDSQGMRSRYTLYPQFINPDPALMHAMDREEMAQVLQLGMVPVDHAYIDPQHPMYRDIEPLLVKYEYDPRRAVQTIEGLGYARGPDGLFRDPGGRQIAVEIRATPGDLYERIILSVANYWQQSGVRTETLMIPRQRQTDREWRSTRPGFEMTRRSTELSKLVQYHSRQTELPENGFNGSNVSRYMNPEFDALIGHYVVTIPMKERTEVIGQIMQHISSQLNMMPLFYDGEPALISNRLVNVRARPPTSTQTWNVHEWEVK